MGLLQLHNMFSTGYPASSSVTSSASFPSMSPDVLEDLQHMNKKICYNLFAVLLNV